MATQIEVSSSTLRRKTDVDYKLPSSSSSSSSEEEVEASNLNEQTYNRATENNINQLNTIAAELAIATLDHEAQPSNNTQTFDYSLQELFNLAKDNIFPPKVFFIGKIERNYTPVTHFFTCNNKCTEFGETIKLVCKIGGCIYNCKLGDFTNLNKHLKTHPETHKWYRSYIYHSKRRNTNLPEGMITFIKFFITAYQNLNLLQNPYFRLLIQRTIQIPDYFYFRYQMLPQCLGMLHDMIEQLLNQASYVLLVPDIWEHNFLSYVGLVGILTMPTCDTKFVALGIIRVAGQTAEDIKEGTETIIKSYIFENSKITGKIYFKKSFCKLNF